MWSYIHCGLLHSSSIALPPPLQPVAFIPPQSLLLLILCLLLLSVSHLPQDLTSCLMIPSAFLVPTHMHPDGWWPRPELSLLPTAVGHWDLCCGERCQHRYCASWAVSERVIKLPVFNNFISFIIWFLLISLPFVSFFSWKVQMYVLTVPLFCIVSHVMFVRSVLHVSCQHDVPYL